MWTLCISRWVFVLPWYVGSGFLMEIKSDLFLTSPKKIASKNRKTDDWTAEKMKTGKTKTCLQKIFSTLGENYYLLYRSSK